MHPDSISAATPTDDAYGAPRSTALTLDGDGDGTVDDGAAVVGCGGPPPGESVPDTTKQERAMEDGETRKPSVRDVMDAHRVGWMEHPYVTGVGIGRCEGEPCIVLYLIRRTEAAERDLPERVDGYPVRLEVTGRIVPRDAPDDTGADGT